MVQLEGMMILPEKVHGEEANRKGYKPLQKTK